MSQLIRASALSTGPVTASGVTVSLATVLPGDYLLIWCACGTSGLFWDVLYPGASDAGFTIEPPVSGPSGSSQVLHKTADGTEASYGQVLVIREQPAITAADTDSAHSVSSLARVTQAGTVLTTELQDSDYGTFLDGRALPRALPLGNGPGEAPGSWALIAMVWRNTSDSDPDPPGPGSYLGTTTAITASSITTAQAGDTVIWLGAASVPHGTPIPAVTPPPGLTAAVTQQSSTGPGEPSTALLAAYGYQAAAGATGALSGSSSIPAVCQAVCVALSASHTPSASDTGSLADGGESALQQSPNAPGTDTASGTEAASIALTSTDTAAGADTEAVSAFYYHYVTDGDSSRFPPIVVSDSGSFTDAQSPPGPQSSDTLTAADAVSIGATLSSAETGTGKDGK